MTINSLFRIIEKRRKELPQNSYVASLLKKGNDRVIQKIGEEAIEVVIAAKNKEKQKLVTEVADLWFHLLILLSLKEIKPDDILEELKKRHNNH